MVEKKTNPFEEYKYSVLVGVGSFILFMALIFAVGKPLWTSYKKTSQTLKEKKAVLVKLEEKLDNLKKLKSKETEIKEKYQRVLNALPTDKDVARLFIQFEKVANDNGLLVTSIQESGGSTSSTQAASDTVRAVSYTMNGTATDYKSLKGALGKLEEALRILNVSRISISSSGNLNSSITVSTYLRSEE